MPRFDFLHLLLLRGIEKSQIFFKEILGEYDVNQESMGCDESNLDVTDYLIEHDMNNDAGRLKLVTEIREKCNKATKLTCSAGVSCNRMLAKICSDMNKPNGHYILPHDVGEIENFMQKLNIRKIPSIGRVTEKRLNALGVHSCQDILEKITEIYVGFNNERNTTFYMKSALGIARNVHEVVDPDAIQK
jgi:DNA polymerase kappa